MTPLTIGSLFSGIGGLEGGLERSGLGRVVFQCEIDPFCRRVLRKHWPDATIYEDVRSVGHGAARVDVLCGGFPCQDVSLAGKRAGLAGARSGLWAEYARVVEELAPKIVVIENVLGLRTSGLPRVLADLAALGFDAEWSCLSAAELGAPHIRKRIFIVATHPDRIDIRGEPGWLERACRAGAAQSYDAGENGHAPDADGVRGEGRRTVESQPINDPAENVRHDGMVAWWGRDCAGWRPPISPVRRVDDGIPDRSHGRRLKALGNAVVPQCAELVGTAIVEALS